MNTDMGWDTDKGLALDNFRVYVHMFVRLFLTFRNF
jgi:hypothetical protein